LKLGNVFGSWFHQEFNQLEFHTIRSWKLVLMIQLNSFTENII
jgi:hypothetical protein